MKSKYLYIGILTIIITIFISGCLQEEKIVSDKEVPVSTDDKEVQKWEISNSLKFCLQEYVYGKEESWVDLAENHCKQLLPDNFFCMFGNSKAGTFGVLCTTSEKNSNELEKCLKEKVSCTTDSDCINQSNTYCWQYLDSDCVFGDLGTYCLIYS